MHNQSMKIIAAICIILPAAMLLTGCSRERQDGSGGQDSSSPHPNMVLIPAGEFFMGSDGTDAKTDEAPARKVYLDAFYIDRHEVTNAQYQKFILATGHPPPRVEQDWAAEHNWQGTSFPEAKADHPVVLVSWNDAHHYARWCGKRLPTEAEWEKAARGGLSGMQYPLGNRIEFDHASYDKGYLRSKKICKAGSFKPNNFGLYDMSGNVWEWCNDWYADTYYKDAPYSNPPGPGEGIYHVFRGGSWISQEPFLRCAQRGKNVPDYKSHTVGFRCALSAGKKPAGEP
jgi:formylglycine-generating enzyme required for sulfatase activity